MFPGVIFIVLLVIVVVMGAIAGIIALISLGRLRESVNGLKDRLILLEARISHLATSEVAPVSVPDATTTFQTDDLDTEDEKLEVEFHPPVAEPVPVKPDFSGTPISEISPPWWSGLEETVGKRWMTWAGALALFLSVGFFLKYAFENNWIGPTGRVVLGIGAGCTLLTFGDHILRRRMTALGQGLMGGALAILYVSLFAAFSLYKLIPQIPAFGFMAVVTASGFTLAVLHNAVPLAFLAVLGGFISPLLVSTGVNPRDALFAYLAILNLGVLGVAFFKRWRALDVLAFVGTWSMFVGWYEHFYRTSQMVPTLAWVSIFFLIFLFVPFMYQLRTGSTASLESFLMAIANAVAASSFFYIILKTDYRHVLGFIAVAMSACYVVLGSLCRKRIPGDARSLFGFVALSVVFLTLAVPLHLKVHGITLAWALEGPILLYLGYIYRYQPVRIAGFVVLALSAFRLFQAHWPLHTDLYSLFLNRYFGTALCVPVAIWAYGVIHSWFRKEASEIDRIIMIASFISGGFLTLVILSGEIGPWVKYQTVDLKASTDYFVYCSYELIWALGAAGFLITALLTRSEAAYYSGVVALAITLGLGGISYISDGNSDRFLFLNIRFFAGLVAVTISLAYALVAAGKWTDWTPENNIVRAILFWVAVLVPLLLLSIEAYTYCQDTVFSRRKARWMSQMALSIVWGLYAVVLLIVGFVKLVRPLRIAGLALLALTAVKLVLVDMAQVQQVYRIISFVVLGLMMFLASYLYHELEKRGLKDTEESP
jgi:uncharacterized membrane protein